jgi:Zn-dependent protease
MGWSWTVGKLAGIDLKIHATFILILLWVGLLHWQKGEDAAGVLLGVVFVLALFACVVLHELGHALAARRYGIGTKDITLLPIGGVARLERMPEDPRQEIVVALAGPAVNVVIAAAIYAGLVLTGSWQAMGELDVTRGNLLERLMVVNVFLLFFNLLPAFPMDGGRVLRALLATRTSYAQATQTAAAVGQGMAFLFGFVGLLYNPFLIFIALFVWIGAAQESGMVQIRSALGGIPVSHAMQTHFRTIEAGDSLERAVDLILSGSQHDFPVLENGRVAGVLNREDVFRALATREATLVRELMRTDYPAADSHDMLEDVFRRIQQCGCRTVPVLHSGQLVGLVTADNISEFLIIQSARKTAAAQTASAHAFRA